MTDYDLEVVRGYAYFEPGALQTGKYYMRAYFHPTRLYSSCETFNILYVNMEATYGVIDTNNTTLTCYNGDVFSIMARFFYKVNGGVIRNGQVQFLVDNERFASGITDYNGFVSAEGVMDVEEEGDHILLAKLLDGSDYRGCTESIHINVLRHELVLYLDPVGEVYYEEDFIISGRITVDGGGESYDIILDFLFGDSLESKPFTTYGEETEFSFDFSTFIDGQGLKELPREFLLRVSTDGNKYVTGSTAAENVIIREHTQLHVGDEYDVFTEGVTITGRVSRRSDEREYDLHDEDLYLYKPTNTGYVYSPTSLSVSSDNKQAVEDAVDEYTSKYSGMVDKKYVEMDEEGNFRCFYVPGRYVDPEHEVLMVLPWTDYHDGAIQSIKIHDYSKTSIIIGSEGNLEYEIYEDLDVSCSVEIGENNPTLREAYGSDMTYTCTARVVEYTETDRDNLVEVFECDNTFDPNSNSFSVTGACNQDPTGGKRLLEVTITITDKSGEVIYTSTAFKTLIIYGYMTAEFSDIYTHENDAVTQVNIRVDTHITQNGGSVFSPLSKPALYLIDGNTGEEFLLCMNAFSDVGNDVLRFEGSVPVTTYPYVNGLRFSIGEYCPPTELVGYYRGTTLEDEILIPQTTVITHSAIDDPDTIIESNDLGQVYNDVDHSIYYFVDTILENLPVEQGYLIFNTKYHNTGTTATLMTIESDMLECYVGDTISVTIYLEDNVHHPVSEQPIEVWDNDDVLGTMNTIDIGTVNRNITMTSAGIHTIKGVYYGNYIYCDCEATIDVYVEADPVTLTGSLSLEDFWLGETTTLTEVLTNHLGEVISNAEIDIYVDGVYTTSLTTDKNGVIEYDYTPELAGEHTLTAEYKGTSNRQGVSDSQTCNVTGNISTMTVSYDKNSITMFESVEFTISLKNYNGEDIFGAEITVLEDTDVIGTINYSGESSFTYTPSVHGSHTITFMYEGNGVNMATSQSVEVTARRIGTVLSVDPESITASWMEYIDITTTLVDEEDEPLSDMDIVTYEDGVWLRDDVTDENGQTKRSYLPQRIWSFDMLFEYEGSKYYEPASFTVPVVIGNAESRLTVDEIPDEVEYGEELHFNIHLERVAGNIVDNIAYGVIRVYDNGELIKTAAATGAGYLTFDYAPLEEGLHVFTIEYSGNEYINGCSVTIEVTVGPQVYVTFMKVNDHSEDYSAYSSLYSESEFNIEIGGVTGGEDLTGQLVKVYLDSFKIDEVTISGFSASWRHVFEETGDYHLTFYYEGDSTHLECYRSVDVSVGDDRGVITLTPIQLTYTIYYGDSLNLYGVIESNPTLVDMIELNVYDNGVFLESITSDLYGCEFSFNYTGRVVETHLVSVVFEGNTEYKSASTVITVTVIRQTSSISVVEGTSVSCYVTEPCTFNLQLASNKGVLSGESIVVRDGVDYNKTLTTDSDGNAQFTYTPSSVGTHSLSLSYGGSYGVEECSNTIRVVAVIIPTTMDYTTEDSFTVGASDEVVVGASVTEEYTNSIISDAEFTVYDNGVQIGTTVDKTYTYSSEVVGSHTIRLVYEGTNIYDSSELVFTVDVISLDTSILVEGGLNQTGYVGVTQKIRIGVVSGGEYLEGQVLDIYEGDTLLTTLTTGSDGYATYNYSGSTSGEHVLTIYYDGTSIYNGCTETLTITLSKIQPVTSSIEHGDTTFIWGEQRDYSLVWYIYSPPEDKLVTYMTCYYYIDGEKKGQMTFTQSLPSRYMLNIPAMEPGEHVLRLELPENEKYYSLVEEIPQNCLKRPTSMDLTSDFTTLIQYKTYEFYVAILDDTLDSYLEEQTVELYDNGELLGEYTGETSTIVIEWSPQDTGTHTIRVVYPESDHYEGCELTFTLRVIPQYTTEIEVYDTPSEVVYNGSAIRVNCRLRSLEEDGTFIEYLSGEEVTISLEGTKEKMSISSNSYYKDYTLDVGSYSFLLEYGGSDEYLSCSTTWSLDIGKSRLVIDYVFGEDIDTQDNRDLRDYAFLHDTYIGIVLLYSESEDKYVTPPEFYFYINGAKADYLLSQEGMNGIVFIHYLAYAGDYEVRLVVPESTTYYEFDEVVLTFTVYKIPTTSHFINGKDMLVYDTQQLEAVTGSIYDFVQTPVLVYEDDQLIGESNEEGVFDYTPTTVGYHELYCKTPEDGDYMDVTDSFGKEITGITVDKRTGSLEVQYDSSTYYIGDTLKINTTFKDEKTGNKVKDRTVKVYNDSTLIGTIENNKQFQYELTSSGDLNLKFQFDEDDIYESFTVKDTVEVKKLTPKIYTEPSPIGYTERKVDVDTGFAVRLEYSDNINGIWEFPDLPVHVFDDDEELTVGEMNEQGNRGVDWTPATAGNHTIRVVSDESDTYYSAEYTETVTVEKGETRIYNSLSNYDITDGSDYRFRIGHTINVGLGVYNTNDKFITLDQNMSMSDQLKSTLTDISYISTLGNLSWTPEEGGDHMITTEYTGDNNYESCSSEITLRVMYDSLIDVEMPNTFKYGTSSQMYCRIYSVKNGEETLLQGQSVHFYVDDEEVGEYGYSTAQRSQIPISWTPPNEWEEYTLTFKYDGNGDTVNSSEAVYELELERDVWEINMDDVTTVRRDNASSPPQISNGELLAGLGFYTMIYLDNITQGSTLYTSLNLVNISSSRMFGLVEYNNGKPTEEYVVYQYSKAEKNGLFYEDELIHSFLLNTGVHSCSITWKEDGDLIFNIDDKEYFMRNDLSDKKYTFFIYTSNDTTALHLQEYILYSGNLVVKN